MSDDWKPGDLALCVKVTAWSVFYSDGTRTASSGPPCGVVLTVSKVSRGARFPTLLKFSDWIDKSPCRGYNAARFRKITPGHKIEGFEEPRRLPVKGKADA